MVPLQLGLDFPKLDFTDQRFVVAGNLFPLMRDNPGIEAVLQDTVKASLLPFTTPPGAASLIVQHPGDLVKAGSLLAFRENEAEGRDCGGIRLYPFLVRGVGLSPLLALEVLPLASFRAMVIRSHWSSIPSIPVIMKFSGSFW